MKFSKETIAILKNFATINNGVVLNPGQHIMTRSTNGATHAEATIVETIEEQLAIIDLTGFLNILSLSGDDSEITIGTDENILIKNAKSEINWPLSDASMVVVPKRAINFPEAQVEFELSSEDFNQLMRVSRGMGCDTLAFKPKDGKIVVAAFNKLADSELKKELYTFEVGEYTQEQEFNFVVNIQNLKMVPDTYKVMLWSSGEMFASKWLGTTTSYVIAVETESSSNF